MSVMGAFSEQGVVHYEITNKSFNKFDFIKFLEELETQLKKDNKLKIKLRFKKATLICDNSRIHYNKMSRKMLKKFKLNFLFQSPYSPFLNSAEYAWASIKNKKRRKVFLTK